MVAGTADNARMKFWGELRVAKQKTKRVAKQKTNGGQRGEEYT